MYMLVCKRPVYVVHPPTTGYSPTMPELIRLKVSQEISTNWYDVGVFLLEDETGARIKSIDETCRGNPKRINDEVLQQWIEGIGKMPVTWQTPVKVLHDSSLTDLATDIAIEAVGQAHHNQ